MPTVLLCVFLLYDCSLCAADSYCSSLLHGHASDCPSAIYVILNHTSKIGVYSAMLERSDGDYAHVVLGVLYGLKRHDCFFWCLYPQNHLSIHIFALVMNMIKTSIVKIMADFRFVSIHCHQHWFEDLHHVKNIKIKDDVDILFSP